MKVEPLRHTEFLEMLCQRLYCLIDRLDDEDRKPLYLDTLNTKKMKNRGCQRREGVFDFEPPTHSSLPSRTRGIEQPLYTYKTTCTSRLYCVATKTLHHIAPHNNIYIKEK